ncbi:ATP-dependent helicase [Patescibacteria group bacterium]|nr:ATP-dependent helicase [Patescibacteria group bacterium]
MTEEKLNKEQLEAVTHTTGPLLIIAGAGTGKTTVIAERIKYLITKKNIEPPNILALTFTEKAAAEMEERVDLALPYGYTELWISTFHSFCDQILKQEAIQIGLNPNFKLLTEAESILIVRKNIFKFKLNYFRPLGNPTKFIFALIQHFSRLKDEDITVEKYKRFAISNMKKAKTGEDVLEAKKTQELAEAYKTYEELKNNEGVMDFADLISNILKLFRTRKNILKNYQKQFEYILVDEFQDTNYAQNELAIMLAGNKKNITVVGDDDQSIYRFRGSSISNIIQFRKRFPNTKLITLVKNYRSTEEILNSSYKLILNNNPDRLEVKEKIIKKLIPVKKNKGQKVEMIYANRSEDEADEVAKKILELSENFDYKDFAILVRANDHSQSFIRAFQRHKIPFQFLGPGRLFQQEEIKDLVSYLKVLYNFEDSVSLYRVLNIKNFTFNPMDIATLLNFAKRKNYFLFEAIEKINETYINEEAKEKFYEIVKMIKKHIALIPKETAGQILFYFLENSGMLKKIIESKSEKDEKVAKNIAKFFDKLKSYEVEHDSATVFDVVDWIDLSMQMGESPLSTDIDWSENNAVNILSVHSSKGLEFPVVFLVNLISQRFPTRERKETIPIPKEFIKEILPTGDFHLEEERRLFYVGMTRAKEKLFLTASSFYGEGKAVRKISPFVIEALEKDIIKDLNQDKKEETQLSLLNWQDIKQDESIPKKINVKPLSYLSYSQIQTFDICPLHYKMRYILKLPTPQTSSQSFGTSVHATLRDFYASWINGEKIKKEKVNELLNKNWINEGYGSKDHERKALVTAKEIITSYLNKNFNEEKIPIAVETPFLFEVKGLKVGGRIDRIDSLGGNKIEIIDYKTGGNMPDEKKLDKDLQMTIYALAATKVKERVLNKNPEEINLSFYYLDKDKKLTTTRSKKQLEDAEEFLLTKAEEIAKSDFSCSGHMFCANCEFKMLCGLPQK